MPYALPPETLAALIDAAKKAKSRSERERIALTIQSKWCQPLAEWGKKYLPHYFTTEPSKMHVALAEMLGTYVESRGNKNAIIAPRGGAKTTWVSKTFPLYCICHKLEHYILLVGDTTEQSQQNLEAIKTELTDNEALAKAYPDACGIGETWNQDQIVTRNKIKISALGAGKKFRGRTFGQYRAGLIIVDDLDDDEAVMSEGQRIKMWNWFSKALVPMGTADTNFLVVGTALHSDDVIHRLKKTSSWQFECFKGLMSEPTAVELWAEWRRIISNMDVHVKVRQAQAREFYLANEEAMLAGAEVLWPEREPLYFYMEYRASYGELAFLSEYQGVPTANLSAEWPPETFAERIWFDRWPECMFKVMALDPSKGKTDTSDFSAYVIVGVTLDGTLYVEADLARRDTMRIIEDGFNLYLQHLPADIVIEINQYQELLQIEFERQAVERGLIPPITGVTNTIKKQTRIRMLSPYLRGGRIKFKRDSESTKKLVEQLQEFPNGSHDDGPDALQMAVKRLENLLAASVPQ